VVCLIVGVAAGIWGGFFFEYQPEPNFRVLGCPVPAAFFVLEKHGDSDEIWVDYITPAPLLFAASNVFLLAFVFVYPVWLVNTIWRIGSKRWCRTGHC
jgi:hypothetical protein